MPWTFHSTEKYDTYAIGMMFGVLFGGIGNLNEAGQDLYNNSTIVSFSNNNERYNISQIKKHPYFKDYYGHDKLAKSEEEFWKMIQDDPVNARKNIFKFSDEMLDIFAPLPNAVPVTAT